MTGTSQTLNKHCFPRLWWLMKTQEGDGTFALSRTDERVRRGRQGAGPGGPRAPAGRHHTSAVHEQPDWFPNGRLWVKNRLKRRLPPLSHRLAGVHEAVSTFDKSLMFTTGPCEDTSGDGRGDQGNGAGRRVRRGRSGSCSAHTQTLPFGLFSFITVIIPHT